MTKSTGKIKYTKRRPISEEHKEKIRKAHTGLKKPGTSKARKNVKRPDQAEALKGRKYSIEHRLAISSGQRKVVSEGRHPFTTHGMGHKDTGRARIEYHIWKEKLLEACGNKCEKCGDTKRLHAHHKKCFYSFEDLRYDLENGEILCQSCHSKWHAHSSKFVGNRKGSDGWNKGKRKDNGTSRICKKCKIEKYINNFEKIQDWYSNNCNDCSYQGRKLRRSLKNV